MKLWIHQASQIKRPTSSSPSNTVCMYILFCYNKPAPAEINQLRNSWSGPHQFMQPPTIELVSLNK